MTSIRGFVVFALFVLLLVAFQIGCNQQDGSINPVSAVSNDFVSGNNAAAVSFRLVFPQNNDKLSANASILAVVASQAFVTFQLKLLNYDNPSNPFSLISKRVLVQNGSASAVFESLPATTILGKIHIDNGKIDGYSDFHGALDLILGSNTVELAPVGSLMPQDVVANAIEDIVSSSTLFINAPKSLALVISRIVSDLLLDSSTAYEEVINNFSNRNGLPMVEIVSPIAGQSFSTGSYIALVASATDLDGNIIRVEFFQGSSKLGAATSAPFSCVWQCLTAGSYCLTAKAFDNNSAVCIASSVPILVVSNTNTATYTVVYNGNGNTSGFVPLDSQTYQQSVTATVKDNISNLTKTGYTFTGWNSASDGSGTNYNPGDTFAMGASNVTLYAKWSSLPTFTVTYNGNGNTGGSVPTDNLTYQQSITVTVKDNTGSLAKTGYTFAGWNTQADGSGQSYSANSTFQISTNNVILYSQWQSSTYIWTPGNVSVSATNFALGRPTATYTGTSYSSQSAVDGNAMSRWSGNREDLGPDETNPHYLIVDLQQTREVRSIKVNISGYDSWQQNFSIYISSDLQNWSSVATEQDKTGILSYNIQPANVRYVKFSSTYSADNGQVNLYELEVYGTEQTINTYAVSYNGNGNTGGFVPLPDSPGYQQNATVTVKDNTGSLVKTGYTFAGWNTASNGSGVSYNPAATFAMGSTNVTFYAKWSIVQTYTVTYKGNGNDGGSVPIDNQTYQQSATVTVKDNTGSLVKTGYTFAGWNIAADGNATNYLIPGSFVIGATNVTLYAKWVQSNVSPSVSIVSPANNSIHYVGSIVTIRADVNDTDGTINRVEFYQGSIKVGEAMTSPYEYTFSNNRSGNYSFAAKAIDNEGASTTSALIAFSLQAKTNVGGIINTNQTWYLASSPYEITSSIQIAYGSTLTIEPGVVVIAGNYGIENWGGVKAIGTVDKKISLSSLRITGKTQTSSENLIQLDFASLTDVAIDTWNGRGNIEITNCVFKRTQNTPSNDGLSLSFGSGYSKIEKNIFVNFGSITIGNVLNLSFRNNAFYNSGPINSFASNFTLELNSFIQTADKQISLDKQLTLSNWWSSRMVAQNNYWSIPSGSTIDNLIFDKNDDLGCLDYILYQPLLSQPDPNTPDPTPYY